MGAEKRFLILNRRPRTMLTAALLALLTLGAEAVERIQVDLSADTDRAYLNQQVMLNAIVTVPEGYYLERAVLAVPIPEQFVEREVRLPTRLRIRRAKVEEMEQRRFARAVFPRRVGMFELGPAVLPLPPQLRLREKRKEARSESVSLKVRPLPEGAPAEFAGYVGEARLEATLSTRSLAPDAALELTVTVHGDALPGLDMDRAISVSGLADLAQSGETGVVRASDFTGGRLVTTWRLSRKYRPRAASAGQADLTVSLVRLDPKTGRYVTVSDGPFRVLYGGGPAAAPPAAVPAPPAPAPAPPARDDPAERRRPFAGFSPFAWYVLAPTLALALLLVALLILRRRMRSGLPPQVVMHLKAADRHHQSEEIAGFYDALRRALREALYIRYEIGPYGPAETVVRELEKSATPTARIGRIRETLERCAQQPSADRRQRARLLSEVRRLVSEILSG